MLTALLAFIGVMGVSASGPIMAVTPAPPLAIAFWRNVMSGSLTLGAVALTRGRMWPLSGSEIKTVGFAGVALGFHFACFITALRLTSVSTATALVCLQAAFIAVINMVRRIPTRPVVLAGIGVAIIGVFTITGIDVSTRPEALTGDLLAVAGAFLAAIYTIAGAKARETLSTGSYTMWVYLVCAVTVALIALFTGQSLINFDGAGWLGIFAVAIISSILGHTIFNHLLATISPLVVAMVILLEIPGTALLAATFLQERLPVGTYLGLGIILLGLAVVIAGQGTSKAEPPSSE